MKAFVLLQSKKISLINNSMSSLLEKLFRRFKQISTRNFDGLNFDIDQENSHQLVQFKNLKLAVYISKLKMTT